jgi:DNA-binding NarL/FixJ family response regulator
MGADSDGRDLTPRIRVVIVDDQTLMRQGLRRLLDLDAGIEVVGEAGDGDEAIALIPRLCPDVVLLDVRMPRRSGLDVLRALAVGDRLPPTILLTTFDDDEVLVDGVRAGARGYLLKDVTLDTLTQAIREVAGGGTLMRPAVTERILRGLAASGRPGRAADPDDRPERLTRREAEVLRLMAGGCTNRAIADALGATEGTIKNHVSAILGKLGVRSRTQAVLKGIELGYMSRP